MQISEVAKNLNLLGMSILNLAIGQLLHRVKTNDIKTNLVLGMVKNSSTKGLLVDKTLAIGQLALMCATLGSNSELTSLVPPRATIMLAPIYTTLGSNSERYQSLIRMSSY